jgi:hypothetical protein
MDDLSPCAKFVANAIEKARFDWGTMDQAHPHEIVATAIEALADYKPEPWDGKGPLNYWHPSDYTRRELRNIANELIRP